MSGASLQGMLPTALCNRIYNMIPNLGFTCRDSPLIIYLRNAAITSCVACPPVCLFINDTISF